MAKIRLLSEDEEKLLGLNVGGKIKLLSPEEVGQNAPVQEEPPAVSTSSHNLDPAADVAPELMGEISSDELAKWWRRQLGEPPTEKPLNIAGYSTISPLNRQVLLPPATDVPQEHPDYPFSGWAQALDYGGEVKTPRSVDEALFASLPYSILTMPGRLVSSILGIPASGVDTVVKNVKEVYDELAEAWHSGDRSKLLTFLSSPTKLYAALHRGIAEGLVDSWLTLGGSIAEPLGLYWLVGDLLGQEPFLVGPTAKERFKNLWLATPIDAAMMAYGGVHIGKVFKEWAAEQWTEHRPWRPKPRAKSYEKLLEEQVFKKEVKVKSKTQKQTTKEPPKGLKEGKKFEKLLKEVESEPLPAGKPFGEGKFIKEPTIDKRTWRYKEIEPRLSRIVRREEVSSLVKESLYERALRKDPRLRKIFERSVKKRARVEALQESLQRSMEEEARIAKEMEEGLSRTRRLEDLRVLDIKPRKQQRFVPIEVSPDLWTPTESVEIQRQKTLWEEFKQTSTGRRVLRANRRKLEKEARVRKFVSLYDRAKEFGSNTFIEREIAHTPDVVLGGEEVAFQAAHKLSTIGEEDFLFVERLGEIETLETDGKRPGVRKRKPKISPTKSMGEVRETYVENVSKAAEKSVELKERARVKKKGKKKKAPRAEKIVRTKPKEASMEALDISQHVNDVVESKSPDFEFTIRDGLMSKETVETYVRSLQSEAAAYKRTPEGLLQYLKINLNARFYGIESPDVISINEIVTGLDELRSRDLRGYFKTPSDYEAFRSELNRLRDSAARIKLQPVVEEILETGEVPSSVESEPVSQPKDFGLSEDRLAGSAKEQFPTLFNSDKWTLSLKKDKKLSLVSRIQKLEIFAARIEKGLEKGVSKRLKTMSTMTGEMIDLVNEQGGKGFSNDWIEYSSMSQSERAELRRRLRRLSGYLKESGAEVGEVSVSAEIKKSSREEIVKKREKLLRKRGVRLHSGFPVDLVLDAFKRSDRAREEAGKITPSSVARLGIHLLYDSRYHAKEVLRKAHGKLGYLAGAQLGLLETASAISHSEISNLWRTVYKGLSKEHASILDRVAFAIRAVEIGKYSPETLHNGLPSEFYKEYLKNLKEVEKLDDNQAMEITFRALEFFRLMKEQLSKLVDEDFGVLIDKKLYSELKTHHYLSRRLIDRVDSKEFYTIGRTKISVRKSGVERLKRGELDEVLEYSPAILGPEVIARVNGVVWRNRANLFLEKILETYGESPLMSATKVKNWVKIEYFKDGEKRYLWLEPEFAKGWVVSRSPYEAKILSAIGMLLGVRMLKFFATGTNWVFAIKNVPRDVFHKWAVAQTFDGKKFHNVYSWFPAKGLLQASADTIKVVRDVAVGGPWTRRYLKAGGAQGWLVYGGDVSTRGLSKLLGGGDLRAFGKWEGFLKYPQYPGLVSELSSRVGLFRRLIEMGLDDFEAAYVAREVLDYSQSGPIGRMGNSIYPYFNASIQGMGALVRAFHRNPMDGLKRFVSIMTMASALRMANWLVNPDAMEEASEQLRSRYWVFSTPIKTIDPRTGKRVSVFFKMPRDPGISAIAAPVEYATELYLNKNPKFSTVLDAIGSISPVGVSSLPPMIQMFLTYAANYDYYRGIRPWKGPESGQVVGKYAAMEVYPDTNPALIRFGEAFGISPVRFGRALESVFPASNPFVWFVGATARSLFDELPQEDHDGVLAQILQNRAANAFFATGSPYWRDISEAKEEQAGKELESWRLNLQVDALYRAGDYEELGKFVRSQKRDVRKRLRERVRLNERLEDMEYGRLIKALIQVSNPEARAKVFYDRWIRSSEEDRKKLVREVGNFKEILTPRFKAEFRRLQHDSS